MIFTAQDVQLEWVATTDIRLFNYTTLLRVFETLMELNVRQRSPLPELFGKDLSFEVIHDTERFYTGNGRVKKIPEAGDEILAKKSVNTSPAPQLLQPPASRQFNITTSLISKYVNSQLLSLLHSSYTAHTDFSTQNSAPPSQTYSTIIPSHPLPTSS